MTDYSQLKVTELKELVKERSIPSAGLKLKQQYIDALIANDEEGAAPADTPEAAADIDTSPNALGVQAASPGLETAVPNDANDEDYEHDADSDNRKRKRRSVTPPLDAETVSKKLKSAEEEPAQVEESGEGDKLADTREEETPARASIHSARSEHDGPSHMSTDRVIDESEAPVPVVSATGDVQPSVQDKESEDAAISSPRHPTTRALYIHGLVRPLQSRALAEHLASIVGMSPDSDVIETCYLDKMKTHAFVLLNSESAATRIRSDLHTKIWPEEPMRKPLWVDYIPEDRVHEWIAMETDTADSVRWEVVYSGPDLNATASLQEISSGTSSKVSKSNAPSANAPPQQNVAGLGVPGAPSGPRQRSPPVIEQPSNASFLSLDERFTRTEAKPRLYFKPISDDRVKIRFDNLMVDTNPDWETFQGRDDGNTSGSMRRYTFEDDKVVDSGPDFGIFGRAGGADGGRGGRGNGRGFSRGGGGRGRRGDRRGPPRNGDYYAPGGYGR